MGHSGRYCWQLADVQRVVKIPSGTSGGDMLLPIVFQEWKRQLSLIGGR